MSSPSLVALFICASAALAHAQAEHYEPIRVDGGISGTYTNASGRGGFGAVVEPKFLIHDHVGVGARIEGAVQFGGSFGNDEISMSVAALAATLAKGEFYPTLGTARPWVGLGLGMYTIVSQDVSTGMSMATVDQKAGRYFGIAPQLGVDLGRLRLAATYNLILGADIEIRQTVGGAPQTSSYSQSYFTFEMTFRMGGRRKAPPPRVEAPPPAPMPPPAPTAPAAAAPQTSRINLPSLPPENSSSSVAGNVSRPLRMSSLVSSFP